MINLQSIENIESTVEDNENIYSSMPVHEDSIEEMDNDNFDVDENNDDRFGIERRRKILVLQFYLNEFPKKLKVYQELQLETLSNDELDKIRQEFDFVIGCKNTVNISVKALKQSIFTLEEVCCKFTPLKVKGLTGICDDPELLDDVKHWALQNMIILERN